VPAIGLHCLQRSIFPRSERTHALQAKAAKKVGVEKAKKAVTEKAKKPEKAKAAAEVEAKPAKKAKQAEAAEPCQAAAAKAETWKVLPATVGCKRTS
jgi:hypothetical protein